MMVRAAMPGDLDAIAAAHRAAFPTGAEAALVSELVAGGDAVVSLVADSGDGIAGHILFSRMAVTADDLPVEAAGLAPVAVLPDLQGQGIGRSLVRAGLEAIERQGVEICFVLGDSSYYGRFGFMTAAARAFASPYAGPHFMARWSGAARRPQAGIAAYAPAFAGLDA